MSCSSSCVQIIFSCANATSQKVQNVKVCCTCMSTKYVCVWSFLFGAVRHE